MRNDFRKMRKLPWWKKVITFVIFKDMERKHFLVMEQEIMKLIHGNKYINNDLHEDIEHILRSRKDKTNNLNIDLSYSPKDPPL